LKSTRLTYSVKEFSVNPSRAIHRALQGVEVTISLRGVPAVRLVPLEVSRGPAEEVLARLASLPGFHVAQLSPGLPMPTLQLSGPGPSAAEMILEDRR
jgi:antitoxin (DNA-binding transcriptional repressor) of toxin-antitoxin stability system